MNPSLPIMIWSLGAPILLGILILRSLRLDHSAAGIAYAGWVWVAGCLYLCLGLFVYQCLGFGPGSWWSAPILLALPLLLQQLYRRGNTPATHPGPGLPAPARLAVALLALLSLLNLLAAGNLLILESDEATIWAGKAKLMFLSKGFDGSFAARVTGLPHPDYPMLNPLLQAWMYSQAGQILHLANRLPVLLFALALISIAAAGLLRQIKPHAAILLLIIVVDATVFRELSQRAYSDLMVACGCVMALDGWLRWHSSRNQAHAAMACCGMTLAIWSKHDAALYLLAAVLAALLLCLHRRSLTPLPKTGWLALPAGLLLMQLVFNRIFGLSNDLLGDNPTGETMLTLVFSQFGDRIGPVADYIWEYGLTSAATQGIYLVFFAALLLLPRPSLGAELFLPTTILALSLAGYLLVYLGSYQPLNWHLDTSAGRLLFQMTPFAFLWLALLLRRVLPGISVG